MTERSGPISFLLQERDIPRPRNSSDDPSIHTQTYAPGGTLAHFPGSRIVHILQRCLPSPKWLSGEVDSPSRTFLFPAKIWQSCRAHAGTPAHVSTLPGL